MRILTESFPPSSQRARGSETRHSLLSLTDRRKKKQTERRHVPACVAMQTENVCPTSDELTHQWPSLPPQLSPLFLAPLLQSSLQQRPSSFCWEPQNTSHMRITSRTHTSDWKTCMLKCTGAALKVKKGKKRTTLLSAKRGHLADNKHTSCSLVWAKRSLRVNDQTPEQNVKHTGWATPFPGSAWWSQTDFLWESGALPLSATAQTHN